jgi:hypothetical protein
MDAAGPVDAKNASTGPWKTAQTAVSHSAHTHLRLYGEDEINRPAHKISDTPPCSSVFFPGGLIRVLPCFSAAA